MNEEYQAQPLPAKAAQLDKKQPSDSEDAPSAEQIAEALLATSEGDVLTVDDYAIAKKLVLFFLRPKDGMEKVSIFDPSKGEDIETLRPYSRPLPLISEFSRLIGLTEVELNRLARKYPKTIGKALTVAREVQQEYVTHRGLLGDYHPRYAEFVSINLTNMSKDGAEYEDIDAAREDLSSLLDDIEMKQKKLYEPQEGSVNAAKFLN